MADYWEFETAVDEAKDIIDVEKLIELLEAVPDKSMKVFSMGCDCIGRVDGIEVADGEVTITRSN